MGDVIHIPIDAKIRCYHCNAFLMEVKPIYCSENTNAVVEIVANCTARKCRKEVSFSFKICPKNKRVAMPGKRVIASPS